MSAAHLRKPFNPTQLRNIAHEMEKRRRLLGADIVAVRGLSGTIVASAMSALFDTPFAVVRKPTEDSHGHDVELVETTLLEGEGYREKTYGDWIIVDDLVAYGSTVRAILEGIESVSRGVRGRCVGILLYDSDYERESLLPLEIVYGAVLSWTVPNIPVYYIGRLK